MPKAIVRDAIERAAMNTSLVGRRAKLLENAGGNHRSCQKDKQTSSRQGAGRQAEPDVSLTRYKQKRNFTITPEPEGTPGTAREGGLAFVIQKHAATRLHYDFRLELDGVLLSWAVPKGPSLDPNDKRMAVHVEDHPLEYGDFEGVIPAKQYGAGTVMLWDRGIWIPREDPRAGYAKGKLKFELQGEKLRGVWN